MGGSVKPIDQGNRPKVQSRLMTSIARLSSKWMGILFLAATTTIFCLAQSTPQKPGRPLPVLGSAVEFIFNNGPTNRPLNGPDPHLVLKALSIRLAGTYGVCFDTESLRYVCAWAGGFLDCSKTSLAGSPQGSSPVFPDGTKLFSASHGSRRPTSAHYLGHYVHGEQVVLSYRLGTTDILDVPDIETTSSGPAFVRTLKLGPSTSPVRIFVSDNPEVTLLDPSGVARLESDAGEGTYLVRAPLDRPSIVKVGIGHRPLILNPSINPADFTQGGQAQWPAPIVTRGSLGNEPGAYVVDTVALPESNPWNSRMQVSALDFFRDGRCAVCTLSGDVWIVSGLDGSFQRLSWKRFATGFYEPLGLRVVNDVIYILGRDRVTRLHDLNQDGEADFYESFNSDLEVYPTYHAYAFDLQTDRAGNFYFATDGNMVDPFLARHGSLLKLSADGSKLEEFATGFRAANGLSVGPNDEITCSDNQGHWTPSSKISWVRRGGFYGYGGDPRQARFAAFQKERPSTQFEQPLCWLPMSADNSSGGQVWVEGDRWGLPRGSLLHTSYGKCTLFSVLYENMGGSMQGGVWQFPLKFASGIMRGRFNPSDGQLYVGGLKGWQTSAVHEGALQRVRYTGKPLAQPTALHIAGDRIKITFGVPLNVAVASDPANYSITQWNYRWTSKYGSDSWSVIDPTRKGEDPVEVRSASISADGKTVTLTTQPLQAVMQMRVKFSIAAADGTTLIQEIDNTIHRVR